MEGWGRFTQKVVSGQQSAAVELRYGKLVLKEFALDSVTGTTANEADVKLDGKSVAAAFEATSGQYVLRFEEAITLNTGQKLDIDYV